MKSHLLLLQAVLTDVGTLCCTDTTKDFETILSREEHEGLEFLTITLPAFGKDFEEALDVSAVIPSHFAGFAKRGALPRFLGGLLELVFNRADGALIAKPSIEAIYSVRQVTNLFSKLEFPCSDTRERAAIDNFVTIDNQLKAHAANTSDSDRDQFRRMAVLLWADILTAADESVSYGHVVPKHGPGATAEKLTSNGKYNQREWTDRLEEYFPAREFIFTSYREPGHDIKWLSPAQERPVRVVTVPKTMKTPRVIAIEPTCMQYTQQGLKELLTDLIQQPFFYKKENALSQITLFTDQTPNQEMAREGSYSGQYATLDLSEASDRVSIQHVEDLAWFTESLLGALWATRSRHADVPGHGVIPLFKYASMGSALCFPIEAMVFTTAVFCGIEDSLGAPLTRRRLKGFKGQVAVYGDDIIVPSDHVELVYRKLETFGFKINTKKSFWTGKFRESCGKEYYDGYDVSIVKIRHGFPRSLAHKREVVATVNLRNRLYWAGLWNAAAFLDQLLRNIHVPMPLLLETSPGIGRESILGYEAQRECPNLQRPLVKALVVSPVLPKDKLEGDGAMLKFFLKRGDDPRDRTHLERAGRPDVVNTKHRWVQPY